MSLRIKWEVYSLRVYKIERYYLLEETKKKRYLKWNRARNRKEWVQVEAEWI